MEVVDGGEGMRGGGGSSESDFKHAVSLVWSLDMHRYTIKCLLEEEIIITENCLPEDRAINHSATKGS